VTTAFLFPGQGSQTPGMGRPFYGEWPEVRAAFDRIEDRVACPVTDLCLHAGETRLRRPQYTQPAVFAVGLAVATAVSERYAVRPDLVAGHSLGHLTAAAHAGLFATDDGGRLVARRGAAMERVARIEGPGEMVAVLLAAPDAVREACAAVDGAAVAAYNTDRQTVVSGRTEAVAAVREALDDPVRVRDLDVGAAFHSPVMEQAVDPVAAALRETPMDCAEVPVVSDVSAEAYERPETARPELIDQVLAPVDWVGVVETLRERGVDRVVEFPPAGSLSAFVSRTAPEIAVDSIETPADAAALFG